MYISPEYIFNAESTLSVDGAGSVDYSGSGFRLSVGLETWVGKEWSMGAAIFYQSLDLTNDRISKEKITSKKLGILGSATFN